MDEAAPRRWNMEITFRELPLWLKVERTRGGTQKTVLRTAPCLAGLYTLIAVLYAELPWKWPAEHGLVGVAKPGVTFSDAMTVVRCRLWAEWIFVSWDYRGAFAKIPPRLRAGLC
jgi:hypothetical protein